MSSKHSCSDLTFPPPEAALFPHYFENREGLWLHWREWIPQNPSAIVVISIGMGEHVERYDGTASFLSSQGYACVALDHQGHGLSEGDRVYVERFENFLIDFELFLRVVFERMPHLQGLPRFLLGHSMGGLIGLHLTIRQANPWAGLILTGPALEPNPDVATPMLRRIAVALSNLFPKMGLKGLDIGTISNNPAVVKLAKNEHLYVKLPVKARTGAELLGAMDGLWEVIHKAKVPLLLLHGSEDLIAIMSGSERLAREYPVNDKKFVRYDGMSHELLTDKRWREVLNDVITFMRRRAAEPVDGQ